MTRTLTEEERRRVSKLDSWSEPHDDDINKTNVRFLVNVIRRLTAPEPQRHQCTRDPNTCKVAFCDFSKCLSKPTPAALHD